MPLPSEERIDAHVHPKLKEAVVTRARADGQSMNELVSVALCAYLGLDPGRHLVPRKPLGRGTGKKK